MSRILILKERVKKMYGKIFLLLGIAITLGVFFVKGYLLFKQKNDKKQDTDSQKSGDVFKTKKRNELIDAYCEVCKAVDKYRNWKVYKECFVNVGPIFQLLLGSERGHRIYGQTWEDLLISLEIAIQNSYIQNQLNQEGFFVNLKDSTYDEDEIKELCREADENSIKIELEKQKKQLAQYKRYLNYEVIIKKSGVLLNGIIKSVSEKDVKCCSEKIEQLKKILEENGCFVIFADDKRVRNDESLLIDFREDYLSATELPGFYTKDKENQYHRIGNLCGTVRKG